jgi:hypothetical protein
MATAKASDPLPLISRAVVEIEIGDDGNAALGGKAQRDLLADAAGRTRDDRNLVGKTGHSVGSLHASLR